MANRPRPESGLSEALEIARELAQRGWASVRRTPGLLLLSLLIGGALWIFVTDSENPTRIDVFPSLIRVEAVNVGPGLGVASTLPSVQVLVSAPDDRWEQITSANLRAFVDLNGLEARAQQVRVSVDVEGISGVRVIGTVPEVVTVNLEPLVTKEIAVTARLIGAVPIGYEVVETETDVDTVSVSGPESLVELVRQTVAEANVSGITVPVTQTVDLTARGEAGGEILGVRIDPPTLRLTVDVQQTTLSRTLPLEAPLSGEPASGYRVASVRVSPATIVVQGTIEVLQGLDIVSLPLLNISGAGPAVVVSTTTVRLPAGVRNVGSASVTVTVSFTPIIGSMRIVVAPQVVAVPEGLEALLDVESVAVVVEGPLTVLGALVASQVQAAVDATGLSAGVAELPVLVAVPAGLSVVSVQPATLSVTLEQSR
ncbi:MAG: CdaR family protein [Dehalococcoidia bacterium]